MRMWRPSSLTILTAFPCAPLVLQAYSQQWRWNARHVNLEDNTTYTHCGIATQACMWEDCLELMTLSINWMCCRAADLECSYLSSQYVQRYNPSVFAQSVTLIVTDMFAKRELARCKVYSYCNVYRSVTLILTSVYKDIQSFSVGVH